MDNNKILKIQSSYVNTLTVSPGVLCYVNTCTITACVLCNINTLTISAGVTVLC